MRKSSPFVLALFLIACGGETEQGNIPPPGVGSSDDEGEVETYKDKPAYEQVSWDFGGDDETLSPPAMGRMIAEATGGQDALVLHMAGSLGTAAYLEPTDEEGTKWSVDFGTWFIDPDNDESTGFPAQTFMVEPEDPPTGFSYVVEVHLGHKGEDGNMAVYEGGLKTGEYGWGGGVASFGIEKISDDGGDDVKIEGTDMFNSELSTFDDERVTVRLPYAAIGAESGDTIRLCFIAPTTESGGEKVVGEVRTMELP